MEQIAHKPTLSIIIPIYNGARYLRENIQNVLAQPCKDFELILLDDGSKDESLSICKEFDSPYIRLYTHANMGVSRTRNKGIELSRGEILIFIDQDDVMRSNFYTEKMRNQLKETFGQGIDLIVTGAWSGDENLEQGTFLSIEKQRKGIYNGRSNTTAWGTTFTFNMNIFSRRLFFDEENKATAVRFFELPLDVETIFRHLTQYAARKILYADNFSFCIRRNNKISVSSNWNWIKVHPIKCEAYYDLIQWHKKYYPHDVATIHGAEKAFLQTVTNMIKTNYEVQADLASLKKEIGKKKYYHDLQEMIIAHPEESILVKALLTDPIQVGRLLHIGWFRHLIRKRWTLYEKLGIGQKKIDLRGMYER